MSYTNEPLKGILNLYDNPNPMNIGLLSYYIKPQITTLPNGLRGYYVPDEYETKANDKSQTLRQKFVQLDNNGNAVDSWYFDPNGEFIDVTKGNYLNDFIKDPDTYDSNNPSGFDKNIFTRLQQYKGNQQGLKQYLISHPDIKIFKQDTTR